VRVFNDEKMTRLKNKKMATLGLYMIFIGGIISITGGFIYNNYKDISSSEKHSEVIKKQNELGGKLDTASTNILNKLEESSKAISKHSDNKKEKKEVQINTKNQIINNTPNQGIQINENKGTIITNKVIQRNFSVEDARKILSNLPVSTPIEIELRGTTRESKGFFQQVVSSVQSLGFTDIKLFEIGMYIGETFNEDFVYGLKDGKFHIYIYPQD
jgi:ElaB/YqjD/DUF883 family membrane-anchored ribosome-binding protein